MTTATTSHLIGCTGMLRVEEQLRVPVCILDYRFVWNREDLLVTPLGGEGQKWVSASRVSNIHCAEQE